MSPRNMSPWERPEQSRDAYGSIGSSSYPRGNIVYTQQEQFGVPPGPAFVQQHSSYMNSASPSYGSHSYDPRDSHTSSRISGSFPAPARSAAGPWSEINRSNRPGHNETPRSQYPIAIGSSDRTSMDFESRKRTSPDNYSLEEDESPTWNHFDTATENQSGKARTLSKVHSQRRPANRDEFDGPHQFLDKPGHEIIESQERDLPHLSTNLFVNEQDDILSQVNDCLSKCAFDFVAKYQFPIPLEADKRPVRVPADREWTEWVYLLKRLATKRRIPSRVLYNGQIKQLVTVLENSLEMRHAAKHQSRPLKDDRNVLQLISAGLQVAKILKDATAMEFLDRVYVHTEQLINKRKITPGYM